LNRRAGALLAGLRPPAGWGAELVLESNASRLVSWAEGKPRELLRGATARATVRALGRGRQGVASGVDTSPGGVRQLWARARAAARVLPPDRARVLPRPSVTSYAPEPEDPTLFQRDPRQLWADLGRVEKELRRRDARVRKALRLTHEETRSERALVNSRGVAVADTHTEVSFGAEVLGAFRGDAETVWGGTSARSWAGLRVGSVVDDLLERLSAALGGRPLPSGRWPVVFAPRVGVDFLDLLAQAVSAEAVQRGRSCLGRSLGKTMAASSVAVVDDGRRPGGLASAGWDDEGHPTQRTPVITGGRLRGLLHTTETARRGRTVSTGNAVRAGGVPAPGPSNFFMEPGAVPRADLLKAAGRAFWVWDVIGMHTADPASGDFSVGASGAWVEKGRVRRGVRGVTLAGNLKGVLSGVTAVADDLTWLGSFGAPTFLVKGLTLGGS
jgi:PmbA protein